MIETIQLPKYVSSTSLVRTVFSATSQKYLLLNISDREVVLSDDALNRMIDYAESTGAGMVYSDYIKAIGADSTIPAPLIDIQSGSLRDDFDFGAIVLVTRAGIDAYLARTDLHESPCGGFYQMRLAIQETLPIVRVPQPLYTVTETDLRTSGQKQFDYVNPSNRAVQIEMEKICTEHLKHIGGYLKPGTGTKIDATQGSFPVLASVIIPVRNRERTIADAVKSALSQQLDGPFNVIVVDNHFLQCTGAAVKIIAVQLDCKTAAAVIVYSQVPAPANAQISTLRYDMNQP